MIHHFWHGVTALGDGAVLLPCALLMLVWLLAVLLAGDGVALTKLLYMGWGLHPPGWDFIGLSGHSALSFLFWPVAGALVIERNQRGLRVLMIALGVCLALTITVSRLVLHDHSPSGVILGALWGALLTIGFLALTWRQPVEVPEIRKWMIVSPLLLVVMV